MFASVLHLRGGQVTEQPHVDPITGDILCWNGEVGFVFLIGLDDDRSLVLQVFEGMEVGHNTFHHTKTLMNAHIDQFRGKRRHQAF